MDYIKIKPLFNGEHQESTLLFDKDNKQITVISVLYKNYIIYIDNLYTLYFFNNCSLIKEKDI
jgi:hypothetical protein